MSDNGATDITQYETLLKQLLEMPNIKEQAIELAKKTIHERKMFLYKSLWSANNNVNKDQLNDILNKEENRRLMVSFNDGEYRWTISISNTKIMNEEIERPQKGV